MRTPKTRLAASAAAARTLALTAMLLALGGASAQMVLPREVRERILQTVVDVRPYDAAADRFVGTGGSGTIISPDGYVLTNFHVVGDLDTGRAHEWHGVYMTDPRAPDQAPAFTYWARYVAGDARHDLAIVQIVEDADENPLPAGFRFPSMPVGDSNTLIPGDPITVVGYPGISGATITFTSGIVSGFLGEDLSAGGKQWIKTDAKLARGNSGGAAFDENGVLIGIPTLRQQTDDGGYIEQQDYLRPVALAWPLITAHVANVNRIGGVGSQVASIVPTPTPTPILPAQPMTASGTTLVERGALAPGDDVLEGGEYIDVYLIDAIAGQGVDVVLTSSAFDAYLMVFGPDDALVLEVDDTPGQGSNVADRFVPAVTGTYVVGVTSFGPGETGAYELRVTGAATATTATATAPTPVPGTLLEERGRLTADDFALDSGEYVDTYSLDLRSGVPVTFELRASEFDVYLVVLGPDDSVVLEVDDSPGQGLDVLESFVPELSGTYLIAVTSAFANETGAYELQVRSGATAAPITSPDPFATPAPPSTGPRSTGGLGSGTGTVGPLALGEQVRAELAGGGDRLAYHTYVIDVPAGTRELIVEMAADVDLDLFMKHGSDITSLGDDGDWDYRDIDVANRASFTVASPAPGPWYVDVVWVSGTGSARYTLRAR